jgi:Cd2+/Zn2+-exporting ATPase
MGALGSDAAIEAADIVLMDDNLKKIPVAVRIARQTLRIVKENIVFSLVVKIGIMILGALGLADMKLAVFGDVGVLVLAILNALRVHRIKA